MFRHKAIHMPVLSVITYTKATYNQDYDIYCLYALLESAIWPDIQQCLTNLSPALSC